MTATTAALEIPVTITLIEEFAETMNNTVLYDFRSAIENIPASFFKGLKECDEGLVVDMKKALKKPPVSRKS